MTSESFESVLDAAKLGSEWAWKKLYEETAPRLHSYLRVRGARDPDGLVGDVFLAAAEDIGSFRGDNRGFRAWLFTIAHARLVDERRRAARRLTDPADITEFERIADDLDVETEALRRFQSERLQKMFLVLAPDQRDVLTLRIIADLSLSEAAAVLGKTVGSVKVLQHRGLRRLKELAAREGVTK